MFQVPIRAPTASRMKIAPIAVETPPTAASAIAAAVYPFLNAIRLANAALKSSATCKGPSVALTPKSQIVTAMSAIRTTTGSTASSRVGGLGCRPRSAVEASSPATGSYASAAAAAGRLSPERRSNHLPSSVSAR